MNTNGCCHHRYADGMLMNETRGRKRAGTLHHALEKVVVHHVCLCGGTPSPPYRWSLINMSVYFVPVNLVSTDYRCGLCVQCKQCGAKQMIVNGSVQ